MAAAANASGGGAAITSVGNSALYSTANSENLTYTEQAGTSTNKQYISFWMYYTGSPSSANFIISCDDGSNNNRFQIYFATTITVLEVKAGSVQCYLISTRQLRDIGWYNIELLLDTTQSIASNRNILKVNNERLTEFSTETNFTLNDTFATLGSAGKTFHWGRSGAGTGYLGAYLAESVRIDGDPVGISTGEYDTTGLYWTPKSSTAIKELTFGTNGFYLDNTTNAQTDASGEGNNFTNNNTVTTTTHTPTNLNCMLSPLDKNSATVLSNGNRTQSDLGASWRVVKSTFTLPTTGKWYWEMTWSTGSSDGHLFGVCLNSFNPQTSASGNAGAYAWSTYGSKYIGATSSSYASAPSNSDKIGYLFDADAGTLIFYKNNASQGTLATGLTYALVGLLNVYSNLYDSWVPTFHFNEAEWTYSAPTDHKALTTTVLAETTTRTASDTNKYFQTTLYEGNGAGQRVGAFQPFDSTFTIAKSALFHGAADEFLVRTNDEAQSDTKKFTYSTWIKRSATLSSDSNGLLSAGSGTTSGRCSLAFKAGSATGDSTYDELKFEIYAGGWVTRSTTTKLASTSEWYHVVLVYDAANSTAIDTLIIYVNGVKQTLDSGSAIPNNLSLVNANGQPTRVGSDASNTEIVFKGYMANTAMCDGQAYAASDFGVTDTSTNRWVPKDVTGLTFGTNGFLFQYQDSSALGDDTSGNTNDFANGSGVTQTTDSPTTNVTVLSPNRNSVCVGTLSNGNRTVVTGSSQYGPIWTEMALSSGKWYWEAVWTAGSSSVVSIFGITTGKATSTTQQLGYLPDDLGLYSSNGKVYNNNVAAASAIGTYALNDVMGIALDMDAKTVKFYKNNSLLGTVTLPSNDPYYPAFGDFDGGGTATWVTRFASADWSYSAPTDHLAVTQDNLAGTEQFISAFSWIKNRDATDNHMLFDRVRGATKDLHSNETTAEVTNVNTLQSFLEAGVQVGNDVEVNTANESYVLWNWMIEATGTGASNTAGSINTTSTLVDTTLGLSISTYTGTGANATIGHGLGVVPEFFMVKQLGSAGSNWMVYHSELGATKNLVLDNSSDGSTSVTRWNNTEPTSTLISLGTTTAVNGSSATYICYAFAPSQFISIGSYKNNNNANGTFVPTLSSLGIPIQPTWILTKTIASANWFINDNKRIGYNVDNNSLFPNVTTVEATTDVLDIVTGGFKLRTASDPNYSTSTTVYMAIGTPIIDTDGRIIAGR